MLTRYIEAAMHRARFEWLSETNEYYGSIAELAGVWATGASREICAVELRDVLEDWIALGISLHHRLPILDGIDVNIQAVALCPPLGRLAVVN